jgi:hypothetical protein
MIRLGRGYGHLNTEPDAAFLHLSCPDLHVEGARREERFTQGIEILRTEIVQVSGQENNFSGFDGSRCENQSQRVRVVFRIPSTRTPRSGVNRSPARRRRSG